jgi:hypothetical protein
MPSAALNNWGELLRKSSNWTLGLPRHKLLLSAYAARSWTFSDMKFAPCGKSVSRMESTGEREGRTRENSRPRGAGIPSDARSHAIAMAEPPEPSSDRVEKYCSQESPPWTAVSDDSYRDVSLPFGSLTNCNASKNNRIIFLNEPNHRRRGEPRGIALMSRQDHKSIHDESRGP